MDSRVSCFAPIIQIKVPSTPFGKSLINVPAMAAREMQKSKDNAHALLKVFETEADEHGILHEIVHEHGSVAELPALAAEYARLRDLTILPVHFEDFVNRWDTEAVIFKSGRPAILVPEGRVPKAATLNAVAVAWDYSRAAARAIGDALPVLRRAKAVYVVTVLHEKSFDVTRKTHDIGAYLARHQITALTHEVDAAGRPIGDVLQKFVDQHHVDLLVMGAYGHSRWREFVLGSATQSMLANPPIPLMLSH
jgi:nucleotide-binding universal stress UspA family protein